MGFGDFLFGKDPGKQQEQYLRDSQGFAVQGFQQGIGNIPDYYQQYQGMLAPSINTAISGMELQAETTTRGQQAALARMLGTGGLIYGQAGEAAAAAGSALMGRTLRQQANMDVFDRAQRTGLTEASGMASIYGGAAPQYGQNRGFLGSFGQLASTAGNIMTGIGVMQGKNGGNTPTGGGGGSNNATGVGAAGSFHVDNPYYG